MRRAGMASRRTRAANARSTQTNGTINLVESDSDSVILDSPPGKAFRRSLSEESIIFVEKKRLSRPQGKKVPSVSSDSTIIIDDESPKPPVRKIASSSKCNPDIEPEFMSLKTGSNMYKESPKQGQRGRPKAKLKPSAAPLKGEKIVEEFQSALTTSSKSSAKKRPANRISEKDELSTAAATKIEMNCINLEEQSSSELTKDLGPPNAKKRKRSLGKKFSKPGKSAESPRPPVPVHNLHPGPPASTNSSNQPGKNSSNTDDDCVVVWESAEVLCVYHNIAPNIAQNLIALFDNDNTIPFIARYRRGLTNNMEAEQLRVVRDAYEELKSVKDKAKTSMNKVRQLGKLTKSVKMNILSAKSVSELEEIMTQFKTLAKGTLAERARNLGLEGPAIDMLLGNKSTLPIKFVDPQQEGLGNVKEVELGMQHIIAEAVSKNEAIVDFVKNGCTNQLMLVSKRMRQSAKLNPVDKKKMEKNALKFQEYFDSSLPVSRIRPHTAMALNRGEKLKILSIKITPGISLKNSFLQRCFNTYNMHQEQYGSPRQRVCQAAFDDAWDRLVLPSIARHARTELTKSGEKESLNVFASNLKQILLMPPLKGAVVLGIDPGFLNGCKLAVITPAGEVMDTGVIYPKFSGNIFCPAAEKLGSLVKKCKVKVIALGDGTASSETSAWLGKLMEARYFQPAEVSYSVVSERGASIYSCSPEAKEEFPVLDPNVISAVSIARRLQEPLAELVKVDPKHLGVGMYQHDLPDAKLKSILDEVVQECVSFVGVDLNTASQYLLRRVAGLSESKAKCVIKWRGENGPFTSRQQLLSVKGIGAKSYEQCAGFVRIIGSSRAGLLTDSKGTSKTKVKVETECMPNLLDSTNVHPEAYKSARELIRLSGAQLEDLGKPEFQAKINSFVQSRGSNTLSQTLQLEDEHAVVQLVEALTQGPAYDIRAQNRGPVFRQGFTKIEDLRSGEVFTGCVNNVTTFGAFVDIGVGTCGLVHISRMKGLSLHVSQRIQVEVLQVDVARKRIGLAIKNS